MRKVKQGRKRCEETEGETQTKGEIKSEEREKEKGEKMEKEKAKRGEGERCLKTGTKTER